MAQLTACDNCGKTEPTNQGLLGWWEIKEAGELLIGMRETLPPYTLCCWVCVAAYAAKREQAAGANRRGVGYRGRAQASDDPKEQG